MRRRSVAFVPAARREAEQERRYYERAAGLGAEFVAALAEGVSRIRRQPEATGIVETVRGEAVRRILLERFPFRVVYVVRDRAVIVVAVAHVRRRPDYWKRRLGN